MADGLGSGAVPQNGVVLGPKPQSGHSGKASDSRPSSEDGSIVAAACGGLGGRRDHDRMACVLGRRPSWWVENELGEVFPHVLGSGNVPPPPSMDNYPS